MKIVDIFSPYFPILKGFKAISFSRNAVNILAVKRKKAQTREKLNIQVGLPHFSPHKRFFASSMKGENHGGYTFLSCLFAFSFRLGCDGDEKYNVFAFIYPYPWCVLDNLGDLGGLRSVLLLNVLVSLHPSLLVYEQSNSRYLLHNTNCERIQQRIRNFLRPFVRPKSPSFEL